MSTILVRHFATARYEQSPSTFGGSVTDQALVAYCVLFCVAGKALATWVAAGYAYTNRSAAWQHFESRRVGLEWLWVSTHTWMLSFSVMGARLAALQLEGWSEALLLVVWFVPSFVFFTALDFSETQLEMLWLQQPEPSERLSFIDLWIQRIRLGSTGGLVMCLVPVLLVLGVIDLVVWLSPGLSDALQMMFALLALGIGCLTCAPAWMRAWIGASAFAKDDEIVARVSQLCARSNVAVPEVLRVGIGRAWHGAALVGWTKHTRQLWLGDALLHRLSPQQLDMVLLHEIAHLRRGHCWWRLVPLLVCGAALVLALASMPNVSAADQSTSPVLFRFVLTPSALGLIVLAGSIVALLGLISQQCELDADREACRAASNFCLWAAERPDRAAVVLTSALVCLHTSEADLVRWHWLHPSVARRASWLTRAFTAQLSS